VIGFAAPWALLGLLAVPLTLALLLLAGRRRRRADAAFGGPDHLRRDRSAATGRLGAGLLLGAIALAAVAAARPTFGEEQVPVVRRGVDVAIALDVSRSMSAGDLEPSRAEVAATGLGRLLDALPGDRVGLVTFAGTAFSRSPLTLDTGAVSQLVRQAQGEGLLVDPGTDLALALEAAIALLDVPDPATTQVIVVVSDGEHVGRDLEPAIRHARDAGIRVYTVAAGTDAGAALPSEPGISRDEEPTRVDRDTLRSIAEATGGSLRDVETVAGLAVELARLRRSTLEDAEDTAPVERFQWFVGGALALLAARWLLGRAALGAPARRRRSPALAMTVGAVLVACGGTASYQLVHEGNEHYVDQRFEDALGAYGRALELLPDDPSVTYNIGNTLHRLGRFEEAAIASAAAVEGATDVELERRATYALGNHAFRRADLEAARDAYIAVLRADPTDEDARHNLELVLALLAPPEDPVDQTDGPGDESDPGGQDEQQPGDEGAGDQPGASPTPGAGQGSGGPGSGAPTPTPGAGEGPGGQGGTGQGTPGGENDPTTDGAAGEGGTPTPLTPEEAQALLAEALQGLGDDVSLEEALAVLDRLRQLNSLEPLPGGRRPGLMPDR
jgi:Ca-activated chloride channel family protein